MYVCMYVCICMTERGLEGDMDAGRERERERDGEKEGTRRRLLSLVCAYCKYTIRENGTYSNEALHIHGVRHTRANLIHLHTLVHLPSPSFSSSFPLLSPPLSLSLCFVCSSTHTPSCRVILYVHPLFSFSPFTLVPEHFPLPLAQPSTRSIMHCQYLPAPTQSVRSSISSTLEVDQTLCRWFTFSSTCSFFL